ncbi:MAG: hypothetical protein J6Q41_04655 [Firmicutes bacterium]|nr:hypothetical protein [Bacillota bacterium]
MNETKEKGFIKRFGGVIGFIVIVALFVGVFVQNGNMIEKMNKILSTSETSSHEIYDDTKVIEAYKKDSKEGLDEEEAFLYDTLKKVIPEITKEGMTVYEKEKAAYDWVFELTHFNEESLDPMSGGSSNQECYKPYDVIRHHQAICVGNATTFKLMMDALDIPCKIVHSTQNGEHAWDVVQLDDEWYHVDVTFDGGTDEPSYSNFNVPDSMKDDGSWPYDHDEIPACNGTKYCYLLLNAKEADDMYGIPKIIAKARDKGRSSVSITVKDTKGLTTDVANYIASSIMVDNGEVNYDGVYSLGGKSVLVYQIYNWGDSNSALPDEVTDKFAPIFEKINKDVTGMSGDGYFDDNGDYEFFDSTQSQG